MIENSLVFLVVLGDRRFSLLSHWFRYRLNRWGQVVDLLLLGSDCVVALIDWGWFLFLVESRCRGLR